MACVTYPTCPSAERTDLVRGARLAHLVCDRTMGTARRSPLSPATPLTLSPGLDLVELSGAPVALSAASERDFVGARQEGGAELSARSRDSWIVREGGGGISKGLVGGVSKSSDDLASCTRSVSGRDLRGNQQATPGSLAQPS